MLKTNYFYTNSGNVSGFTDEEREVSLLDPTKPNSKSNPYIIGNANQMYMLLRGLSIYDPAQIAPTMVSMKSAVDKGVKNFNEFVEKNTGLR